MHESDDAEESMHESEQDKDDEDDDVSMQSYDTPHDQTEVLGNACPDFDTKKQTPSIHGPPTIAKLPIDKVFEQLE